jgi:hypothetical protein
VVAETKPEPTPEPTFVKKEVAPVRYGVDGIVGFVPKHKPCLAGLKCFKAECPFDHPDGWDFRNNESCSMWRDCTDENCPYKHPKGHSFKKALVKAKEVIAQRDSKLSHSSGKVKKTVKAENIASDFMSSLPKRLTPTDFASEDLYLARITVSSGGGRSKALMLKVDGNGFTTESTDVRFSGKFVVHGRSANKDDHSHNFQPNSVVLVDAGNVVAKFDREQLIQLKNHFTKQSFEFPSNFLNFGATEIESITKSHLFPHSEDGFVFANDADDDKELLALAGDNTEAPVSAPVLPVASLYSELDAQEKFEADAAEIVEEIEQGISQAKSMSPPEAKILAETIMPKALTLLNGLEHASYETNDVESLIKQLESFISSVEPSIAPVELSDAPTSVVELDEEWKTSEDAKPRKHEGESDKAYERRCLKDNKKQAKQSRSKKGW